MVAGGVCPKVSRQTLTMNSTVLIVEIGTGTVYKSGMSPFGVKCFEWSRDGRFIYVGTEQGRILVCECEEEIKENVQDLVSLINENHFFWDNFGLGVE